MTQEIEDNEFQTEVIESDKPVLVDVWSEWCTPCKQLAPTIDEISNEYNEIAKIVKINMEDNHRVAVENRVQSLPTLLLFKNGKEVDRIVGITNKDNIKSRINKLIPSED